MTTEMVGSFSLGLLIGALFTLLLWERSSDNAIRTGSISAGYEIPSPTPPTPPEALGKRMGFVAGERVYVVDPTTNGVQEGWYAGEGGRRVAVLLCRDGDATKKKVIVVDCNDVLKKIVKEGNKNG